MTNVSAVDILNYALTLEHLEDTFYRQGLAMFPPTAFATAGFDAVFYNNIKAISEQETDHVSFLTAAIKADWPASSTALMSWVCSPSKAARTAATSPDREASMRLAMRWEA